MWLSLMREKWSSIAVVPTGDLADARTVANALSAVTELQESGPVRIIDAGGATVAEGARLSQELAAVVAGGARAVVAVDSLLENLGGVPLVRDTEAALLVIRLGSAHFDAVRSTVAIIGRERVLGSVVLHPERAPSPGKRPWWFARKPADGAARSTGVLAAPAEVRASTTTDGSGGG